MSVDGKNTNLNSNKKLLVQRDQYLQKKDQLIIKIML